MKIKLLLSLLLIPVFSYAQFNNEIDDELNVGGDIFQDFNEDIEAAQVMEDERFYRYSRFFGVNLGLGLTSFTGNRGLAYRDNHPSFHFSLLYFIDFQNAFTMGIEYSKHSMVIDTKVLSSPDENPGLIEVSMLRPFFGFRYYIDTTDLGTAITYSNPYYVGRVEYWYQTNEFPESNNLENESDGGIGFGFGMGLEFPIEIRKKYLNIEFLYHWVNFFDKDTRDYQQLTPEDQAERGVTSEFGYDDLSGDVLSVMVNYHISW